MSQNKIYVGNLSYGISGDDLQEFFGQYGSISECKLITDHDGRSKGFAFITFSSDSEASDATQANGTDLDGRPMKVNIAEDRRSGGGGGRSGGYRARGGNNY